MNQDIEKKLELYLKAGTLFGGKQTLSLSEIEDKIIATGYSNYIFKFARDVMGANVSKLEDAIIALNSYYIINFAISVEGANLDKIKAAVISSGDPEVIFDFAEIKCTEKPVDNDIKIALLKIKNLKWIFKYALYIDFDMVVEYFESYQNMWVIAQNNPNWGDFQYLNNLLDGKEKSEQEDYTTIVNNLYSKIDENFPTNEPVKSKKEIK